MAKNTMARTARVYGVPVQEWGLALAKTRLYQTMRSIANWMRGIVNHPPARSYKAHASILLPGTL